VGNPPFLAFALQAVPIGHTLVCGEGYGLFFPVFDRLIADDAREVRFTMAIALACAAAFYAHAGRGEDALRALERVLPAIERAAGWASSYTAVVYYLIEALWVLEHRDHAEILERNLREKTLAPDFRYPHNDGRLAMARLCALTGRVEEAREWFDKARRILEEQGARPLRAITDFDEAWMEIRRGRDGNRTRALALLAATRGPFESIGMPGWLRRADELRQQVER
jgi:tetratricopeptide (TPR) repeat protein